MKLYFSTGSCSMASNIALHEAGIQFELSKVDKRTKRADGVDFATISQWLGHAGLNTTMRYARADIDLKRRALAQAFPDAIAPPPGGRLLLDGADLVSWMRRL